MSNKEQVIGVLLAAGKGVRAYPATKLIPKALLEVDGIPLIERNIKIMRDHLGISEIIIVVGHYGDQLVDYLGRKTLDINFKFVIQKEQKGIGHALLTAEEQINGRKFIVMLADEFYLDSQHEDLLKLVDYDAVLMFRHESDKSKISRNYTGIINHENRVLSLVEKPVNPDSHLMGVGTYLLSEKIFYYIRSTPPSALRGEVEITDVLSNMAKNENVFAFIFQGTYVNVNSVDELNHANYLCREKFIGERSVTVVIPAYNEEKTIVGVIEDYIKHPLVNEVLVVDNNSADRTNELSVKAGARVVLEKSPGYGCALRRGLKEATGDIIVLTEADGSFSSKDIQKFIEYLKDCDMVIGTRTTRQMIEQGANMESLLRFGNIVYGKIIELLWWGQEPRFTDVGCTYRAIWKKCYEKISPMLNADGPDFSPEMMIAVMAAKKRVIEIPVSYRQRIGGESHHSGTFFAKAKTATKMMKVILKHRFLTLWP